MGPWGEAVKFHSGWAPKGGYRCTLRARLMWEPFVSACTARFRRDETALKALLPAVFARLYYVIPRWQVGQGMRGRNFLSLASPQIARRPNPFSLPYAKPEGRSDLDFLIVREKVA